MPNNENTTHGFALLPEDGTPARLLRFGTLPHADMLSVLDPVKNILRISPTQYERLPHTEQARLDITHEVITGIVQDELGVRFVPYEQIADRETHSH